MNISKCCEANVNIASGDEGTNYYQCCECGKPCDVYNPENKNIVEFKTGATRSGGTKPDFSGYLSPLVIERFGEYMLKHQQQPDGSMRESDNWQKGIPLDSYMSSGFRHFLDWWTQHRGFTGKEELEESLCAVIFNASGYLHEILKKKI